MRALAPVFLAVLLTTALSGCVRHVATLPRGGDEARQEPPPGVVEVNVVAGDAGQVWQVSADGRAVCTTPCVQWFSEGAELSLQSSDGDALYLPNLGAANSGARRLLLVAEGTSEGKRVNGIVFTTFGGMGVVTAITLSAVGCSNLEKRGGVCTAGLITGAVSLPLSAFAIWILVDSHPKTHLLPVSGTQGAMGQPPVRLAVTPSGVVGTF